MVVDFNHKAYFSHHQETNVALGNGVLRTDD